MVESDVPFRIKVSLIILAFLAAMVAIVPVVVPIAPLEGTATERELAYPDSVFVTVGALDVHVQTSPSGVTPDEGFGPDAADGAFVLLHGFGSHTVSWHAVAPLLADRAPVIAFDRPAFGLTERPMPGTWGPGPNPYAVEAQVATLVGLMDAYGVERAVLVGHSAGAAVALEAALAHPGRVAGVVVVGGAIVRSGGPPAWTRPLLRTPHLERLGPVFMRQLGGASAEHFLRSAYADPERLDPEVEAAYRRSLSAHDWDRALWEHTKASREVDLLPRLGAVRPPVLVVTGVGDLIVPPEQSEQVAAALPNARLVRIPACGHVVQEECPALLHDAIDAWLDELGPGLGHDDGGDGVGRDDGVGGGDGAGFDGTASGDHGGAPAPGDRRSGPGRGLMVG